MKLINPLHLWAWTPPAAKIDYRCPLQTRLYINVAGNFGFDLLYIFCMFPVNLLCFNFIGVCFYIYVGILQYYLNNVNFRF